jgi:hypothetical protein
VKPSLVALLGAIPGAAIAVALAVPFLGGLLRFAAVVPPMGIPILLLALLLIVSIGGPATALPALLIWMHRERRRKP